MRTESSFEREEDDVTAPAPTERHLKTSEPADRDVASAQRWQPGSTGSAEHDDRDAGWLEDDDHRAPDNTPTAEHDDRDTGWLEDDDHRAPDNTPTAEHDDRDTGWLEDDDHRAPDNTPTDAQSTNAASNPPNPGEHNTRDKLNSLIIGATAFLNLSGMPQPGFEPVTPAQESTVAAQQVQNQDGLRRRLEEEDERTSDNRSGTQPVRPPDTFWPF